MQAWRTRLVPALLAVALAAGCDDKPDRQRAASGFDAAAHARRVAEEAVLARAGRPGALLRAVQVHRQALAGTIAVCGQINPSGRGDEAFIPFVTVVTYEDAAPQGAPRFQLAQHLADTSAAATRVYAEMVSRCFEGGGPRDARRVQALPPLPSGLPRDAEDAPATVSPPAAPGSMPPAPLAAAPQAATRSSIVTRQHANVRTNPGGGGSVLRVVPPGAQLRVFGEAPGGWYQIGDTEPWGWVHGSMLGGP